MIQFFFENPIYNFNYLLNNIGLAFCRITTTSFDKKFLEGPLRRLFVGGYNCCTQRIRNLNLTKLHEQLQESVFLSRFQPVISRYLFLSFWPIQYQLKHGL